MLHLLTTTLAFLGAVFILTTVHELGHFIVARFCNVKVIRFSIGFGKPLWRWYDKHKTEYVLAAIPLGGYVKLLDGREGKVTLNEQAYAFDQKTRCQRFAVLSAGPLANIIFAILGYWLVFVLGINHAKPIVGAVLPNSIVAQAGLQSGDEIVAVGNEATPNWPTAAMRLLVHYGETNALKVTVRSADGQRTSIHDITLNLHHWRLDNLRPNLLTSLGIKPHKPAIPVKTQYSLGQAVWPAIQETWSFTKIMGLILYKLATGIISWQSLGGPFSIFQSAGVAAGQGFIVYLNFLAFFSVNIAILNMLPIPGLDGAQLTYILVEWIRGKPVSIAFQVLAFRLGLILLCVFFLQLLLNDLLRSL